MLQAVGLDASNFCLHSLRSGVLQQHFVHLESQHIWCNNMEESGQLGRLCVRELGESSLCVATPGLTILTILFFFLLTATAVYFVL